MTPPIIRGVFKLVVFFLPISCGVGYLLVDYELLRKIGYNIPPNVMVVILVSILWQLGYLTIRKEYREIMDEVKKNKANKSHQ